MSFRAQQGVHFFLAEPCTISTPSAPTFSAPNPSTSRPPTPSLSHTGKLAPPIRPGLLQKSLPISVKSNRESSPRQIASFATSLARFRSLSASAILSSSPNTARLVSVLHFPSTKLSSAKKMLSSVNSALFASELSRFSRKQNPEISHLTAFLILFLACSASTIGSNSSLATSCAIPNKFTKLQHFFQIA